MLQPGFELGVPRSKSKHATTGASGTSYESDQIYLINTAYTHFRHFDVTFKLASIVIFYHF